MGYTFILVNAVGRACVCGEVVITLYYCSYSKESRMNGQYQQPLDSLNNDNKYVGLQGLGQGELAWWLCRSLPMACRERHMLSSRFSGHSSVLSL